MFQAGAPWTKDFFWLVFLQIGDCVLYIFKSLYREDKGLSSNKIWLKNPLFLSHIKPHGAANLTTLAIWVKSSLAEAEMGTTKFKDHSSRSASSSAAYEPGVALPDIMEAADFTKFDHKRLCKSSWQKQFWVKLNRGHW